MHTTSKSSFPGPQKLISRRGLYTFSSPVPRAGSPKPSSAGSPTLLPQLGPQIPSSPQGARGSAPLPPAASGRESSRLTASPASFAGPCPPGSSYSALGANFGPGGRRGRWALVSRPGPAGGAGAPQSGRDLDPQAAAPSSPGPSGPGRGAQALLPRGRLCGECSSTDCRRRTSRSSQSVSGSSPFSTARRSDRLLAGGNRT